MCLHDGYGKGVLVDTISLLVMQSHREGGLRCVGLHNGMGGAGWYWWKGRSLLYKGVKEGVYTQTKPIFACHPASNFKLHQLQTDLTF